MVRVLYIPRDAGLGRGEIAALQRLSSRSVAFLLSEMDEPGSRETIVRVLRERDPEAALAREIARETRIAAHGAVRALRYGLGDAETESWDAGLSGLKKFRKKMREKFKKSLPKPLRKIHEKVSGITKKVGRKYGNVIIMVAGAVLAPFTGGASLAAASALTAANTAYQKKREAQRIAKVNKKESARLNAEVAGEEAKLAEEVNKIYAENKEVFAAAGIDDAAWGALTLEQKLAVIEKISKGQMPASPEATREQAEAQGVPPPPTAAAPTWQAAIKNAPIAQAAQAAEGQQLDEPAAAPPGAPPEEGPPPEEEGPPSSTAEEAPKGRYELYVEGRKVSESGEVKGVIAAAEAEAKPGDRFEILLDGKSLGLKIRTPGGAISVPADRDAKVRAMSHGDVRSMVARASANAEEGEKKGFPILALAIPAALIAATAA